MKRYISIEYWSKGDICGFGYSTNYKNIMHVACVISERDYPYIEEGVENGDREFIPTFQKVVKEYITSNILVTPSQRNALEKIQLHEFIKVTIDNKSQLVTHFKVESAKNVEADEYEELRLRFQVKYEISRSLKEIVPRSAILGETNQLPEIATIVATPLEFDGDIYDGLLVAFTGVEVPNIYKYTSNTGEWVNTEAVFEDSYFINGADTFQYYWDGLNFKKNAEITTITLSSGTTYLIKGNSRIGYIRIEGTTDGGTTWVTIKEDYSGVFTSTGISVNLLGYDDIRAVYYEHGGETYTGEEVANPISVEYLEIIQALELFESEVGNFSDSQNFTIEGTGTETTDVVITAPTGFQVSLDDITFTSSVTVTYSGGIALTTIYVRMTGETSGYYSGNISLEVDTKTYNVFVEGNVYCDVTWIGDYLDIINGEVIESTIEDKLDYLLETKGEIAQAIEDAGGTIDPEDTFRDYADRIGSLGSGCVWEEPFEF